MGTVPVKPSLPHEYQVSVMHLSSHAPSINLAFVRIGDDSRRAGLSRPYAGARDRVDESATARGKVAWTVRARARLETDHRHGRNRSATMTPLPDMQRIKREITIDAVLAHYGVTITKRSGSARVGACPIHGAATTSRAFRISADGHAWYCFGDCQRGGSVIDLVAALEGCSICDAAAILRQRFGVG
jgi:CHC2 zinc finger